MEVASALVMVPITEIKPYHRNARQNAATVDKLVELIPKVGFNVPLVLDRDNVIVKGHSRWQAGIRLALKALPCVYTDADPETIKLDRLADNKVQEFSLWDKEMLGSELASLNLGYEFNLGLLDFKIELPAFEVAPVPSDIGVPNTAASPAGDASGPGGPVEAGPSTPTPQTPFITAEDVARSVPLRAAEYLEVVCDQCGHRLHVKK